MSSLLAALQLVSSNSKAWRFLQSSKLTWLMNVLQHQHHVLSFCAEPHRCCEPAAIWAGKNSLWCTFLRWSCYCWVSMMLRNAHLIFTVSNLMYCFLMNSKEAPIWGNKNEFFWLQFLYGWGRLSLKWLIMMVIYKSFQQCKFLLYYSKTYLMYM